MPSVKREDVKVGHCYRFSDKYDETKKQSDFTPRSLSVLGFLKDKTETMLTFYSKQGPISIEGPSLQDVTEDREAYEFLPPTSRDLYVDRNSISKEVAELILTDLDPDESEPINVLTIAIGTHKSSALDDHIKKLNYCPEKGLPIPFEYNPDTNRTMEERNCQHTIIQFDNLKQSEDKLGDEPRYTDRTGDTWYNKMPILYNIPTVYFNSEYQGMVAKRALLDSNLVEIEREGEGEGEEKLTVTQKGTDTQLGEVYYNTLCEGCELPEDFILKNIYESMKNILKWKGYIFVVHEAWHCGGPFFDGKIGSNVNFEQMIEIPMFFKTHFTIEEQTRIFRVKDRMIRPLFDISVKDIDNTICTATGRGYSCKSGPSIYLSQFVLTREEARDMVRKKMSSTTVFTGTSGGRRHSKKRTRRQKKTRKSLHQHRKRM